MTTTYLDSTKSVALDGIGQGVISFTPDTGQWWLPTLVHVGTKTPSGNIPQVGLHSGELAGKTEVTSLKDYTFSGNNDTSTILSGSIVFPNTAIVVHFIGGNPGDHAFATVIGLSSDIAPTIGIEPTIPGARFTGAGMFVASGLAAWRANKTPIGFFRGPLAVNATGNLLPAVAGRQYYLHGAIVVPSNGFAAWSLQDTNNSDIGIYSDHQAGAPANVAVPTLPAVEWHGSPLPTGTGLQIKNLSGGLMSFSGHVTYGY